MPASIIDGAAIGRTIRGELAREIAKLRDHGVTPGLAAVLVGDHAPSRAYVRMKARACEEAGLHHETLTRPAEITEDELVVEIDRLNDDPKIHGILVQLPLPSHISTRRILQRVSPDKDVDGFHPENLGRLAAGDTTGFKPATPYGVQQLLLRSGIETTGRHAVVLGRSAIVGRPMALLLLQDGPGGNATVTVCHSRTREIAAITRTADILIVAIGRAGFVTGDMIKPGAAVIDVGINRVPAPDKGEGKTRVVGDVDYAGALPVAGWITPVPGGVGPMTIACLLANTVTTASLINGLEPPKDLTP